MNNFDSWSGIWCCGDLIVKTDPCSAAARPTLLFPCPGLHRAMHNVDRFNHIDDEKLAQLVLDGVALLIVTSGVMCNHPLMRCFVCASCFK